MKRRVLGILSLFALVMVVAISSAILSSAGRELTQEVQINRVSALNRFAQVAYDASQSGDPSQLRREMERYSGLYGEGILVRLQETATVQSGGLSTDRPDVRDAISRASLNLNDTTLEPLQPFGSDRALISRSFGSASQVLGEAVLEVDLGAARQKLRERWLLVGLGAAGLSAVLLLGALRATGWVIRPVLRLNAAVAELEATGRAARLPEAGPPELKELSRSFTKMAETVSSSTESQRRLIADTSHQLRNPIGALRLRIDLLQLELRTDSERAKAEGVVKELERVEEILDDVLKLATAEHRASEGAANQSIRPGAGGSVQPIDPYPVLQEGVDRARPAAKHVGSRLVLKAPPQPPLQLHCSAAELAQMVGELITNAIKYAPGAAITVGARPLGGSVVVEVSDDGPGLPPEELAAAATRFWRSPRHAGIRGTGLGMTIVDRLAGANGGRLTLRGRDPHGLLALLEFPAASATSAPSAAVRAAEGDHGPGGSPGAGAAVRKRRRP
ncbi:ATP-binding protein [Arthrobacter sp. NPDC057013]|uniref:sensor histidine kinase n=1 Tax=Arthrobacter sp. NPDC057013 TaxID=3345999 RepID=UPI00363DC34A